MPHPVQLHEFPANLAEGLACWAERIVQAQGWGGLPLTQDERIWARNRGVCAPEKVRIVVTPTLPFPDDPQLKLVGIELGLIDSRIAALTLGYLIFSRSKPNDRVLKHELRHVHQYEMLGGVRGFLLRYTHELLTFGYSNAPLEVDARNHETLAEDSVEPQTQVPNTRET